MNDVPKLSFIVLSYNYADLIGQTIRSILDQTVQDFEIVVVDDASRDSSCDVVRSFGDPRIRLLVNEQNLGGAGSYNRAVEAARGEYLANLDADDWIVPEKTAVQLAFLCDSDAAVIGSYADFVDRAGRPALQAAELEAFVNRSFDLNAIDCWIGHNRLVRSSTMIRRTAHLSVGLDDPSMVRAPDYELWTRFLRAGHRLAVIPQKLLFYRVHTGGVTHGDPRGSFLEMSYAILRNLVPLIQQRAAWPSLARIVEQWLQDDTFVRMRSVERYRLLGMLLGQPPEGDFASFRHTLENDEDADASLATAGRRLLALITQMASLERLRVLEDYNAKLARDIVAFIDAREFWRRTSDSWQARAEAAAGASWCPSRFHPMLSRSMQRILAHLRRQTGASSPTPRD